MFKLIISTFYLILIICTFGMLLNAQDNKSQPSKSDSAEVNAPSGKPELEIIFDKKDLVTWCHFPGMPDRDGVCSKSGAQTQITVLAKDIENHNLTYKYIVSGGEIVGEGKSVLWDFSQRISGGEYTIKVTADDGKNIHLTSEEKIIRLLNCDCDPPPPPCNCPSMDLKSSKQSAKAGEILTFTAKAQGGTQKEISYNWTISAGTIISG